MKKIAAPLLLFCQIALASPDCPNPTNGAPALSFTIASYHQNELGPLCRERLKYAKMFGFTAVTIVPAVMLEYAAMPNQAPTYTPTFRPDELTECLNTASRLGLDVHYMPHIEMSNTLDSNGETDWRAVQHFKPDGSFQKAMFGTFLDWLRENRSRISAGQQNITIMLAAELDRSVGEFPAAWGNTLEDVRSKLKATNLQQVKIGMNPNWDSANPTGPIADCAAYRKFVKSVDFVAPSLYGNWTQHELGSKQPAKRFTDVTGALVKRCAFHSDSSCEVVDKKCTVPEFEEKLMSIGEFGIGDSLSASDHFPREALDQDYKQLFPARRKVFKNILDWMRLDHGIKAPWLPVTFWTYGGMDAVGISGSQHARADLEILLAMREYTEWRCPGIVLPALQSNAVLNTDTVNVCSNDGRAEPVLIWAKTRFDEAENATLSLLDRLQQRVNSAFRERFTEPAK